MLSYGASKWEEDPVSSVGCDIKSGCKRNVVLGVVYAVLLPVCYSARPQQPHSTTTSIEKLTPSSGSCRNVGFTWVFSALN